MAIQLDQLSAPLDLKSGVTRELIAPILNYTQGFILEKHRRDFTANVLLRFHSTDLLRIRKALASLPISLTIPNVFQLLSEGAAIRAALDGGEQPVPLSSIAFIGLSSIGIAKLGLAFHSAPLAFAEGFKHRLSEMPGRGDISDWQSPWADSSVDALVVLAASSKDALAGATSAVRAHWQSIAHMDVESGAVKRLPVDSPLEKGIAVEHFGFADETSQPEFFTGQNTRTPSWQSTYDPAMKLSRILVSEKLPAPVADRFGSYMAYLKIEQHLDRFEAVIDRQAGSACPMSRERAAELIMGRRKDGKQLIDPARHENDYAAEDDPDGVKWPFASHTRKMNSRDKDEVGTRILRRGVPYEDGESKGLLFQSFQASIQDQFEEIFINWGDQPHRPKPDTGSDPLVGRALSTPLKFPSDCPEGIQIANLTTLRGGEYFYFPSLTALEALGS